MVIKIKQRLMS